MILIDFNQIAITRLHMFFVRGDTNENIYSNPILGKSLENDIFTFLKLVHSKYGSTYGNVVNCMDDATSWRKGIFPNYKAGRKKAKGENPMWPFLHTFMDDFHKTHHSGPVRTYRIPSIEADDIIARLVETHLDERHLIVSKDKDFHQLHSDMVFQYDYSAKKIVHMNGQFVLKEHIIRGDKSDGIPNILSEIDILVQEGGRQTPMTKPRFNHLIKTDVDSYDENTRKRYEENRVLISLRDLPVEIKEKIDVEIGKYPI